MKIKTEDVINQLKDLVDPKLLKELPRFGINTKNTLGVPIPKLRKLAKEIGKGHELALKLWDTGIHDAKILASLVDAPNKVTEEQMDLWVHQFDSWDVCDQVCSNLFYATKFAYDKAKEWSFAKEEFVKRAGFVLMACFAQLDKKAKDPIFERFFPIIIRQANDERNFVKKAVNWALRQIGKRNITLNKRAIQVAEEINKQDNKCAKWISSDALRELKGEAVQNRLKKKAQ